jgi:hypothetical protein
LYLVRFEASALSRKRQGGAGARLRSEATDRRRRRRCAAAVGGFTSQTSVPGLFYEDFYVLLVFTTIIRVADRRHFFMLFFTNTH